MTYLTLTRITGEPRHLLAGYLDTAETMTQVGRDHELILHAAASTSDGLLIVNLWPSAVGSQAAARDPRRRQVLAQHNLDPAQLHYEHHELANCVLLN
jgi:hypothetical protein